MPSTPKQNAPSKCLDKTFNLSINTRNWTGRRQKIIFSQHYFLQEDYRQGREALTRKNLINLAQHLWEYLLLNNSTRVRTFSSMYHDRGWTQYSMQHVTTFEQRVQMLLQFIRVFTSKSKPRATQLTRFTHMDLEESGILTQHTESL